LAFTRRITCTRSTSLRFYAQANTSFAPNHFSMICPRRKKFSRAAAKRQGVMVGQSSRFFAPYARQRKHFESGVFGEIITVEAYYNADHRWFLKKGWAKTDAFKWLTAA